MSEESPYTAHTSLIESVLAASCRMHRLAPDHADEFRSWARLRLLENDQAILRKFGGRSRFRTFLVTVVERLFLDWRNHEWGKWRPSSEARRVGAVAIELERLVGRDGWPFEQAAASLVSRGVAASGDECERVWMRLPRHPRRQRVHEEVLATVPATGTDADPVEEDDHRRQARRLVAALECAVEALPAADQQILRLRYWSGVKVSRIAVLVGEEQKTLYRRYERLWSGLRQQLAVAGLDDATVTGLLASWRGEGEEDA